VICVIQKICRISFDDAMYQISWNRRQTPPDDIGTEPVAPALQRRQTLISGFSEV
jgi:hypothetical protein